MSSFSDKFNEFKDKAEALADEAGDKLKEGWDSANYMTWDMYTKYAEAVQKNNLTFEYTLATSVPVRASKSLQAIVAKSDTSEDKTGGKFDSQIETGVDKAKDALDGAGDDAKDAASDAVDSAKDAASDVKDAAGDAADSAKDAADDAKAVVEDAAADAKAQVEDATS